MSRLSSDSACWLTVIVPVYNGEAYIVSALESIKQSDTSEIEVLIIDDGSNDRSLELIHSFEGQLPLRIYSGQRAGSWVRALNVGIQDARGAFVTVLCQDDLWEPKRLDRLRPIAEAADTDVSVIVHPSYFITANGRRVGTWRCPFDTQTAATISKEAVLRALAVQNFVSLPGAIFRSSVAREIPPFDLSLWFTPDWLLWLELALRGRWIYIPDPLSSFRLHEGSQTAVGAKTPDELRRQYRAVQEAAIPRLPFGPNEITRISRIAELNTDLNVALAAAHSGSYSAILRTLARVITSPISEQLELLKASRFCERVGSRILASQLNRISRHNRNS